MRHLQVWDRDLMEPLNPQRAPVEGDLVYEYIGKSRTIHHYYKEPEASVEPVIPPIRVITTGSMQRRFTILEEEAIENGLDSKAKVIKSRLMNADYCDLDFTDTQEGVGYICNYLASVDALYNTTNPSVRLDSLLIDGTNLEEYKGQL